MINKTINNEILLELKKPMQLKWRVQRAFPNKTNPTHVIMVAYSDARDIQDRLDDVLGASNWQTKYYECKNKQFCEIGIKIGDEWVWKGDNGTESTTEKQKGETSDSFKRAAVHWGVNRQAYSTGEVKLPCKLYNNNAYPCSADGKFLKGKSLYEACNKIANTDSLENDYDLMMYEKTVAGSYTNVLDLKNLFELKEDLLNSKDKEDILRIIENEESDKFKFIMNKLKSL